MIWSRFSGNPVLDFVDLCSNCNLSVFLMTQNHFGYYIHGRGVHGPADVGLGQMYENLAREEVSYYIYAGRVHRHADVGLGQKYENLAREKASYYIHGSGLHWHADEGLEQMYENL